jgi:hypothetical protein
MVREIQSNTNLSYITTTPFYWPSIHTK